MSTVRELPELPEEREAFEIWFIENYHDRLDRNMPDGSYNDPAAHSKWDSWQARAAYGRECARLAAGEWISLDERLPADDEIVVVGWLDAEDPEHPERHDFDWRMDDCWQRHEDDYQHFCACAPAGSRGPKAAAPYTHWMRLGSIPLPPPPASIAKEET